jgi:hypothetical protein
MDKWRAQVKLSNGTANGSFNLQWIEETAKNSFEARLAMEAKYGKLVQGPIRVNDTGSNTGERYADSWK